MKPSLIIQIAIADDHAIFRQALRRLLETESDLRVVAEFSDGGELCGAMANLCADVLLLDMLMLGPDPLQITAVAHRYLGSTAVVALTAFDDDSLLSAMVSSGATGFLLKTIEPERLFDALRRAAAGEALFTREQLPRARRWRDSVEQLWLSLSERERAVAILLAQGMDNQEIVAALGLSLRTVESHVAKVLDKLHVDSRLKVAVWIRDHLPEAWWRLR